MRPWISPSTSWQTSGPRRTSSTSPIVYAVARGGMGVYQEPRLSRARIMHELFETVLAGDPGTPEADLEAPFQMLVTSFDYSEYLGRIVVGRVRRGKRARAGSRWQPDP